MIIESVELDNFKSFGNKKRIMFRDGFTVITGPNGSGKSNIGDAMLFVLGIRSSKAIRADRLPDLIHKAPPGKKQGSTCSVTIVMDSQDSSLPEEERKTRITREISVDDNQECKSTYYINGAKAKRGDVETILDNAQIYLDAYSFVLQGDINNLVKMTGTERRKLLESIAGIENYNVQIDKAQSDIDGIEDNLSKIQILIDETQRRADQLAEEKKNAERYNEITAKIGSHEATLLRIDHISAERELAAYMKSMEEIDQQISASKSKISELQAKIAETESTIISVEEEKNRFGGDELKKVVDTIRDLTLENAKEGINLDNLKDDITAFEAKIKDLAANNEFLVKDIEKLKKETEKLKNTIKEDEKKIAETNQELDHLRSSAKVSSKAFSKYREEMEGIDRKIIEANARIIEVSDRESNHRTQREKILSDIRHLESRESDVQLQYNDAKYKIDSVEKDASGSKKAYDDLNKKYLDLRKAVTEGDRKKDDLNRKIVELTKEYEKLSASLSRTSQSSRTYSAILEARASGELTGVHGLVKDLVSYESKFQMAVGAAGGSRLNSVVVEDDSVAEQCLNILKRKKAGKLTFLPMNKILNGRPRAKAIMVRNSGESLGYVFENVNYDKKYENIIWYAFQDCLILPDVPTARKHMSGVRLVTLEGDIFEASGAITGGFSEKKEESSEKRTIEVSEQMSQVSEELERLKVKLEADRLELDAVTTQLSSSSKKIGSGSSQVDMYIEIRERSSAELAKIKNDMSAFKTELQKVEETISVTQKERSQIDAEVENLVKQKEVIAAKLSEISPESMEKETELESALTTLRQEKEALSSSLSMASSDLRIQEKILSDQKGSIEEYETQIQSKKEASLKIEDRMRTIQSDLEKHKLVEEQLNVKAKEYNDRINSLNIEVNTLRGNVETAGAMIRSYEDNRLNTSLRIQAINEKIQQIDAQIAECKFSPIETGMSVVEIKRTISALRREIESVGAVNQLAIKEYEEEDARLRDLREKTARLKEEKATLEGMMEELNSKKRTVFLDLYYKINESMQAIYSILSEGGEARLDLSDMNDPLNSDLYIRARPKGSTFSKIEALSGGEKSLTAISFILAVQRIKPSPVYYLDEIDMFLDGANAERIGKMFSENAKYSQVLMVSLKKAMLKYADNLIGVTTLDEENSEVYSKDFETGGVQP
ncbi:MAG: chromosome segregation protein SMC [Candidatus Thermoplasmatota archaeon]|nr:chromosome segregation protein SMC [Candidatus Thermoplasmatota archaeon]